MEAAARQPQPAKWKYGDFYLTGFRLSSPQAKGTNLHMLRAKEAKHWRVVAFKREPAEAPPAALPDLRPLEPPPEKQADLPGNPMMIKAATEFYSSWLLASNPARSLGLVSPTFYRCLNSYREENIPPIDTPEAGMKYLGERMKATAANFGKIGRLEDILQPVDPAQPEIGVVAHPLKQAFAIFSVPDHIGQRLSCESLPAKGQRTAAPAGGSKYGNFYATCSQFRVEGGNPAALFLLWSKDGGLWKIRWMYIDVP
jgi:hypothetical protein